MELENKLNEFLADLNIFYRKLQNYHWNIEGKDFFQVHYAASKSMVLSFSRALNRELEEKGITVTAVCPGPVKTEFFDVAQKYTKSKPYKMILRADPVKVVKKALFDAYYMSDISVYSPLMKAFRLVSKYLPHSLLIRFMK